MRFRAVASKMSIALLSCVVVVVVFICVLYQIRCWLSSLIFELLVPDSADVLFLANVVDHVLCLMTCGSVVNVAVGIAGRSEGLGD